MRCEAGESSATTPGASRYQNATSEKSVFKSETQREKLSKHERPIIFSHARVTRARASRGPSRRRVNACIWRGPPRSSPARGLRDRSLSALRSYAVRMLIVMVIRHRSCSRSRTFSTATFHNGITGPAVPQIGRLARYFIPELHTYYRIAPCPGGGAARGTDPPDHPPPARLPAAALRAFAPSASVARKRGPLALPLRLLATRGTDVVRPSAPRRTAEQPGRSYEVSLW